MSTGTPLSDGKTRSREAFAHKFDGIFLEFDGIMYSGI